MRPLNSPSSVYNQGAASLDRMGDEAIEQIRVAQNDADLEVAWSAYLENVSRAEAEKAVTFASGGWPGSADELNAFFLRRGEQLGEQLIEAFDPRWPMFPASLQRHTPHVVASAFTKRLSEIALHPLAGGNA